MNSVNIIGRITHDLELKESKSKVKWVRFSVAVNSGAEEVDFINVVAYEKLAEAICNHQKKGSLLGINGRIKTGKYEHDKGVSINTFDIVANTIDFLTPKVSDKTSGTNIDNSGDDLPF